MNIKPIKIGNFETKNNVFLAPLAGYTNAPFRKLCSSFGAGLSFSEMVSCKGLKYGSENTTALLYRYEGEEPCAVQIFGNDPDIMRAACESEELAPYSLVDINMGCPMKKIYNNGEGSALLADMKLASKIISSCKKSGKNLSVKFRIGLDENNIITSEFAKMCEDSGADMITIHGRTKEKIYSGEPDYDEIAKAVKKVNIPVIANGGIKDRLSAETMFERTGADGIMVAQAALFEPYVFAEILTGEKQQVDKRKMIFSQIEDMQKFYDEHFITVFMRKMVVFYIRGMRGANLYKERLFSVKSVAQLKELVNEIFLQ